MTTIDLSKINSKIKNKESFEISFKYANKENIMVLNSIIARLLSNLDRIFLLNSLVTVIREVVVNAQKANAKRIFFKINNLDIKNPVDYKKGMMSFKDSVIGEFDGFQDKITNSDYYIKISFGLQGDNLFIKVTNNSSIMPEELQRIKLRIEKAIHYSDFSDAYNEIEDDTEGAGLGIVLTILFLKNMGIDPRLFNIESVKNVTETSLTVPQDLRPQTVTTKLKAQIIDQIQGIPTFPENIIELQRLCNDPESSIDDISKKILMDPALASDVIKLSNSAGFVPGKRIESVNAAVMTIGLRNVNALLTAIYARKILSERYSKFEQIWDHCHKVAFYSRQLGLILRNQKIADNAFLAGLLHDLGKIILLSADKKLVMKIADQVKERKIRTSTIMEEISIGISHSTIGELVAAKWNFPEYLVESIKQHHSPLNAREDLKDIVYVVYLANMLIGIEERRYYFHYLEEDVLNKFGILKENEFVLFHDKIKKKYEMMK